MSKKSKETKPQKRVPKFAGIAFEMAVTIGLFVYLGVQADRFFESDSQIIHGPAIFGRGNHRNFKPDSQGQSGSIGQGFWRRKIRLKIEGKIVLDN